MAFDPNTFDRKTEVRLRVAGIYYDEVFKYEEVKKLIPGVTLLERTSSTFWSDGGRKASLSLRLGSSTRTSWALH